MADLPLTGSCLCGAVRFELSEPPSAASYCHCTRCQKRTGTAASANVRADGRAFRITQGEDRVRSWRHPEGGFAKAFCGDCGAHLFSRNPDDPSQLGIRMSAFDSDPGIRPTRRQFVAYAASWEPIPEDGLERFDESAWGR